MAAGFSGYTGGSFGRGEELVTCPYDKAHQISNRKFNEHLMKCRRNYRERQFKEGTDLLWMCCKYNPNHKVDVPELLFHESRCADRIQRLPIHLICSKEGLENELGTKMTDEVFEEITKDQVAAMKTGIYNGPSANIRSILNYVPVMDKGATGENQARKLKPEVAKQEISPIDLTYASLFQNVKGGKQMHFNVREEIKPFIGEEYGTPDPESDGREDNSDDEEDWGTPAQGPTFDLMKNLWNPRKPQMTFPPGLSKAGRREYAKWNTRFMKSIYRKNLEDEAQRDQC